MRKQFILPESDSDFLDSLGLQWETIVEAGGNWLLIHHFPVPEGYTIKEVTVALMIPPGYPVAQIDMAFFHPHLARVNGWPIGALAFQNIDSKTFQRWSRHRTGENPWRPGVDDVSTHMSLVGNWFEKELRK